MTTAATAAAATTGQRSRWHVEDAGVVITAHTQESVACKSHPEVQSNTAALPGNHIFEI
jgi:hypothetical protein